jgi:hypothetical protein
MLDLDAGLDLDPDPTMLKNLKTFPCFYSRQSMLSLLPADMDTCSPPDPTKLFRYIALSSVADPGCLSLILIFTHPGSKNSNKERDEKN